MYRLVACCLAPLALAAATSGCGSRSPSDEEQVRDVLQTFARSAEKRDYTTLCEKVFAPKLLSGLQQIGLPCEVAMEKSLGQVKDPRLTVGKVAVNGDTATAEVRTTATGQQPSSDTLKLQKVKGAWKVSALGSS